MEVSRTSLVKGQVHILGGKKNEEVGYGPWPCCLRLGDAVQSRPGHQALCAPEGRRIDAAAKSVGRCARRITTQREVRQSALSRLYPQPGARAATDRTGRLSALEYVA